MSGVLEVFIVEDSPVIREAMFHRIEEDGLIRIIGYAETAEDAINQLDRLRPDMVLVDLHLAQGTGYDVLNFLNASGAYGRLKAIVTTNYATPLHRNRATALGASGFFDKSLQFEEMLEALHRYAVQKTRGN